jgi:hypothetical protein
MLTLHCSGQTQPSLKEHGSDQVWSAWVKQVLYSHRMFGRIDRKGKVRGRVAALILL